MPTGRSNFIALTSELIKEVGSMGETGCYSLYVFHTSAHVQTGKLGLFIYIDWLVFP